VLIGRVGVARRQQLNLEGFNVAIEPGPARFKSLRLGRKYTPNLLSLAIVTLSNHFTLAIAASPDTRYNQERPLPATATLSLPSQM
jgi:hypothetical protein